MARKKTTGTNGRDSKAKYRGIKKYGGEYVNPGHIIVRQVGMRIKPGENVGMGRDYTIYAKIAGQVKYDVRHGRKRVHVYPEGGMAA